MLLSGRTKDQKCLRTKRIAGRYRKIVEARSLLCCWAVRDLGVSMTSLAKRLKLSVAAITQSVERGDRLKVEKSYHFLWK